MEVEGWLGRAAGAHPQRAAIQTPSGSWSYGELLAAASDGAQELSARGALPKARVAIELAPGLAFAQALHACLLLGAVAVPVDPRLTPGERAEIARGAALLVDEPLRTARGARSTGRAAGDGVSARAAVRHDLDATAVLVHTSGTTAAPRPVALTYGNFLWSALGSAVALGLDPAERWLCTLPVSHVGGLSILLRSCIYASTAVVHERFDTDRVLDALSEGDVTLVSLVATTLARLLDAGLSRPRSLRCALIGGGPVSVALARHARARGVPVSLTYGLTEACSQVTTEPVGSQVTDEPAGPSAGAPAEPPLTAGPGLFCTRVSISSHGEILVRGPTIAPGSIAADGWLHTGDLGSLDAAGRLSVTGRKGDTIVSGGENVAPAEVEAALEAHPDVLEAAVLGRPDAGWGEVVTAVVVARPGSDVTTEALRAHCALGLAPYKTPKQVTLVSEPLPRTPSGKLLRRELASCYARQGRQ